MNYIFMLDSTYTPYESNMDIILGSNLTNGAETVTGICINPRNVAFSNVSNGSITSGECGILVLSTTSADGSTLKSSAEFETGSVATVKIDEDIREKVASHSDASAEQKAVIAVALQINKGENNKVIVTSDSPRIKSILTGEGIEVIGHEASGIPYGWARCRWNI